MAAPGSKRGGKETRANTASSADSRGTHEGELLSAEMFKQSLESMKNYICVKIESAISGLHSDINGVKEELTSAVATIQQSLSSHEERLRAVEDSATAASDTLAHLETTVAKLQTEVNALSFKCEDLESRSRRNNIRLIGIDEGEEGNRPTEFVSNLLRDMMSLEEKPLLDRAHRSLQPKPKSGQPPRPFIIRVHFYHIREQILQRARQNGRLTYKGKPVFLFPDLTANEAKKRAAFGEVRKYLRNVQGARFGFRHPARFRITLPGNTEQLFTDPQKAMEYVKNTQTIDANGTAISPE
uniref:L1 transposable element RRM domain-containing protein n=1 Tax=Sinocyclocheilus grahami TaxID=75366 RepID=A0A672RWL7_SINGR